MHNDAILVVASYKYAMTYGAVCVDFLKHCSFGASIQIHTDAIHCGQTLLNY